MQNSVQNPVAACEFIFVKDGCVNNILAEKKENDPFY